MIRFVRDYPKELVIGDGVWKIRFCRQIPGETIDTVGMMHPAITTIFIRLRQTPEERFKTLCHEVIHAFCYEYKIKENHKIIYQLEAPILSFLLDNGLVL